MTMAFIDAHREELGIEPICWELAVAPSSYHQHAARLANPSRRSARARWDDELKGHIRRVHEVSFGLHGSRKVWRQLLREGVTIAKCTVERLMKAMGLAGIRRGKSCVTTVPDHKALCPLDKVNRGFKVQRPNALWVVDFTARSRHSFLAPARPPRRGRHHCSAGCSAARACATRDPKRLPVEGGRAAGDLPPLEAQQFHRVCSPDLAAVEPHQRVELGDLSSTHRQHRHTMRVFVAEEGYDTGDPLKAPAVSFVSGAYIACSRNLEKTYSSPDKNDTLGSSGGSVEPSHSAALPPLMRYLSALDPGPAATAAGSVTPVFRPRTFPKTPSPMPHFGKEQSGTYFGRIDPGPRGPICFRRGVSFVVPNRECVARSPRCTHRSVRPRTLANLIAAAIVA